MSLQGELLFSRGDATVTADKLFRFLLEKRQSMCQKFPIPRCSAYARKRLEAAEASGDAKRIKQARQDFYVTPAGIAELRAEGRNELADKYEARRKRLIAEAKRVLNAKKTPIKLALDLDETSGGFIDSLRESVAKQQGLTPEEALKQFPTPPHYSLVESGWFENTDAFLKAFHTAEADGVYRNMKAFKGSGKTLRTLVANRDVEVHVVTARDFKWNKDTREWLRKQKFPFASITHTEDKEQVPNIDVYLDDSDKQINTLQSHGKKVIAFTNQTNLHVAATHRVKSWSQVPSALKLITSNA